MRRRDFIQGIATTILWSTAVRAQQPGMPVIGFLGSDSPDQYVDRWRAFRHGLQEAGYTEGLNLAIEYRWAEGHNDKLQGLAADLARRQVSVIVALGSTPAAVAAKAATTTIPIVFNVGADPVQLGLVASLNQPGRNVTGITTLSWELMAKRVELVHEAVPKATSMALLVNPTNPSIVKVAIRDAQMAARGLGLKMDVLQASSERDFAMVFAALTELRADALVIATDAFFIAESEQLGGLCAKHGVPAIFQYRPFAAAGGLMSYGTTLETYSWAGVYTGRILKGEKPADLPIQQSTKLEMIINLKAAKALGLALPLPLLGRADELIE